MAVTVYRSTDAGAPALPAAGNYAGAGFIIDLLKACLVNGYGAKAAAGWTVDYEDTTANKRRIGLSNGNGVIEFVTWGIGSVGMFLWDSITTPGVGAIYDDTWANVASTGVNGWKHERTPMPGANTEYGAGFYATNFNSSNASEYAWTVYADDKSAWVLFHYPSGHANTEAADAIQAASGAYHTQLFMGAIKSPDMARDATGNLFLCWGGQGQASASAASGGTQDGLAYMWGLRTPMDTLPTAGNGSDFDLDGFQFSAYCRNPLSSVRALLPVLVSYDGTDVPKPAALSASYDDYQFAALPGVAQIGKGDSTSQSFFWTEYNTHNSASWSLAPATIGGSDWMPWALGRTNLYECGITDDAAWW